MIQKTKCDEHASLAISYGSQSDYLRAKALSESLQLPIDNQASRRLIVNEDRLMLKIDPFLPLYADFNMHTWQARRDAGKQQGLVRAVKPCQGMKIIDATAGWGRDAAVLASFGADVVLLERNPVMAALLVDGLARQDAHSKKLLRMTLVQIDAFEYLKHLPESDYPDVIYIDPMHPQRQKEALVKKELQVLQQLIGPNDDVLSLVTLARKKARSRVVVKWPQQLAALLEPTLVVNGKTIRFDVYVSS